MKTAVIYARYSSERQTEQSIEGQIRACKEYAERNDINIVDSYIDRAMTGTNDNRAGFQKMLKDSYKKAWDIVLVYKLDRFSRDKYETAVHRHTLKNNGIRLVSAKENIPDTPEGIILESLLEGMNQYYSAELSQKVKRGMRENRIKGNYCGGFILYGYKREGKRIIIDEDEAKVVRKIFEDCAANKPTIDIIDEINFSGIKYRGGVFKKSTVYKMLKNEKYTGVYRFGKEIFTNMYPPIIKDSLFEIVKNKMDGNKYGKHKANVCYLLKGKLFCGLCGRTIRSDSGTSENGTVKRYYNCAGKNKNNSIKKCDFKAIRKEVLEKLIVDVILEVFANDDCIRTLAERIIKIHDERIDDNCVLNLLNNDYNENEKAIKNLLAAIEKGFTTESAKQRLEELEDIKNVLSQKIALEEAKEKIKMTQNDIYRYIRAAIKKQPKQMIDYLIEKILIYNDKMELYFKYQNNKDSDDVNRQSSFLFSITKEIVLNELKIVSSVELFLFV